MVTSGVPQGKELFSGIFGFDQAKALAKLGHQPVVLAVDLRSVRHKRKWGYSSYQKDGIEVQSISFPCGPIPLSMRAAIGKRLFKRLYRLATDKFGTPDLIHSHFTNPSYICSETANDNNIPFFITEHSSLIGGGTASAYQMELAKKAYARATVLLAVSRPLADKMEELSGRKVMVVSNVLDSVFLSEIGQGFESNARADFGFRYITCSNLIYNKGHDILIESFARLADAGSQLTIIGSGPEEDALKSLVQKYHLDDRVHFEGYCPRERIRDLYAQSDCFVLASRFETFGLVYAEAMACGLPVIATFCGGPEDFVTADNGILVPVDDVEGLTNAMAQLCENMANYDRYAIHQSALSRFSPEALAKELTRIYESSIQEL